MTDSMTCSECGAPASDAALETRQPCPVCRSMARTMGVAVKLEAKTVMYIKTRALHREGGHKVVREEIIGDDFYRATGKWSVMRRLIDRINDRYEETFRDRDTGEILHQKAHRLSEHRGFGSAKELKGPPQSN